MSEWIRHRGSRSMPKRLKGKLFEAVDRDGCKWPARDVQDARDWQHTGSGDDIMKYRILGDINPPDYSKGFPVGTTAKDIGAKVGDKFVVVDGCDRYKTGDIVTFSLDDGTTEPYFDCKGRKTCITWQFLSHVPPKTAIELQAEEVGIPEPVQLVDDANPDADGWIEWKGGECPVPDGALVDVKFRDGLMAYATPANEMDDRYPADASGAFWIADGAHNDIVAYRLHQPQEWPEDRMDIVGQNGNDGLHYTSKQQAAEADKRIDDAAQGVREASSIALTTNQYQRTIKGVTVDVYDVLAAFGVTCQARGHAIKKLLMAGQRGHKDEVQHLREAVQAIERSVQLIKGD